MPGKGRAMGYTDYYNNKDNVPGDNSNSSLGKTPNSEEDMAAKRRKEAVQRRLRMRRAGK